ncbi:hypothetical protein [Demequina sp. NBRC 110056]|uniref:hypothetical protein n=1 Tax=Demequina sp. NBRC 110056 TaxID=1570345 RepID=UPI000A02ADB1|nr:hypothetical protein [Demequina sp. NBRC 110056]
MRDLGDELKAQVGADARAGSGAQAPEGVRRAVRRRRRRSALGIGAGSALGVGLLAVAAVATAGSLAAPVDPLPTPSVASTAPIAYATLDLDDPAIQGWYGSTPPVACGDAAPTPADRDGAFSATFDVSVDGVLSQDQTESTGQTVANVTLAADVEETTHAFVQSPVAVLVRDGVVVGYDGFGGSVEWRTISQGWNTAEYLPWFGYAFDCADSARYEPLAGGDYDLYVVTRVTASPEQAAIYDLNGSNRMITSGDWRALQPGSYECEQYGDTWGGPAPLVCDPSAVPGTTIDREAGTITVPFDAHLFSEELDVTLVSEPVTVTVGEYVPYVSPEDQPQPLVAGAVPECGAEYGWVESNELSIDVEDSLATLETGDTITAAVWPRTTGAWSEIRVELPEAGRLWLLSGSEVEVDASTTVYVETVVGWTDVVSVGGTELDVIRYVGPKPWALETSTIHWCDGEAPAAVQSGAIVEDAAITDREGRRVVPGPLAIHSMS